MWLVRHGETDWNLRNIVQGQSDIPLNQTGITQAESLARKLKTENFAAVYASDLVRAVTTARIIASQLGLEVQVDRRLREINQGLWEGYSIDEIIEKFPEEFRDKNNNPLVPVNCGAESVAEVVTRMVQAANDIFIAHRDEKVLLVSHGFAISALYCTALGIPLKNAGNYIPKNGHPTVIQLNTSLLLPSFEGEIQKPI